VAAILLQHASKQIQTQFLEIQYYSFILLFSSH
jgi:hypothetical protein